MPSEHSESGRIRLTKSSTDNLIYGNFTGKICNLLGFDPNRHNWKTEVLAGITSFLTMSYILAVNPSMFAILEGMPQGAVFTTTTLVALISTLLVAFVARMPFGIPPGMGPNAFFVFTVCISMNYSWQFALTAK